MATISLSWFKFSWSVGSFTKSGFICSVPFKASLLKLHFSHSHQWWTQAACPKDLLYFYYNTWIIKYEVILKAFSLNDAGRLSEFLYCFTNAMCKSCEDRGSDEGQGIDGGEKGACQ